MSALLKSILMIPSGGALELEPEYEKIANIFGIGHVCTRAPERLVVTLTSLATLSISVVRLVASPPAAVASLCTLDGEVLTPTLASVVSLSTE
ncbi:unnamed protein product, partial [marine sediment metagenome]